MTLAYGDRTIIDGLDLQIAPGRITTIVRANGCGKSTLLRLAGAACSRRPRGRSCSTARPCARPTKEVARVLGLERVHAHEQALTRRLVDGLAARPWVRVLGPRGTGGSWGRGGLRRRRRPRPRRRAGARRQRCRGTGGPLRLAAAPRAEDPKRALRARTSRPTPRLLRSMPSSRPWTGCLRCSVWRWRSDGPLPGTHPRALQRPVRFGLREPFEAQVRHVDTCGDGVTLRVHLKAGAVPTRWSRTCHTTPSAARSAWPRRLSSPRRSPARPWPRREEPTRSHALDAHQQGETPATRSASATVSRSPGSRSTPARVKCALLSWMAFTDALHQAEGAPQ